MAAYGLTNTTEDVTKPLAPPEDDLSALQPKKKAPAPGGIPLAQTSQQSPANAAVSGATMASPDPMAFVPLNNASNNIVQPTPGYDMALDGINPPPSGGTPVTPPPPPTFGPADKTPASVTPNTPASATVNDAFTALYGADADAKRKAYVAGGGDPTNDAAIWSQFTGNAPDVAAAKARYNAFARSKGYNSALADAEAGAANIEGAGGFFRDTPLAPGQSLGGSSLEAYQNAQSRQDFINSLLRQAGYDPTAQEFMGEPSNVNPNAVWWDDLENSPMIPGANGFMANPNRPSQGGLMPGNTAGVSTSGVQGASSLPGPNAGPVSGPFGSPSNRPATAPGAFGGQTSATAGPNGGVGVTNIDPNDSLIGKQFQPDSNVDRVKLVRDSLNSTIENVLNPQRAAAARDLNRYAFGSGRGVSGIARTRQGDLANEYDRHVADLINQGVSSATGMSIDDMYRNLDELQQERGFQKDLSDTAFGQSVTQAQLEDLLTNSAFGRSERQSQAGESGNPSDIALILSNIFGSQSSAAQEAAARLFGGLGSRSGASAGGSEGGGISLSEILRLLGLGSGDVGQRTTGVEDINYGGSLPA